MFAVLPKYLLALLLLGFSTGAHANSRFIELEPGIVLDRQTSLHWQQDGTRKAINFLAATNYCENLQLGDRNNWRLPGVKELISLVDEAHYKPSAFPIFRTVANLYWSATVNPKRPGLNWTVNFSDGHVHAFRDALDFSVRCVSD